MSFRIVIVAITLFTISVTLSILSNVNAEVISYNDVVRDTLRSSARLKVKKEDINIAHASYRQNFASLYPEITLSSRLERYENLDKSAPQGIKSVSTEILGSGDSAWRSSLYLLGQYDLSSWYKRRFEVVYYEKLRDAREFDCAAEANKLLREVTDLFGNLSEGYIKLRYSTDILEKLKALQEIRQQSFLGGEAAHEEVLKAEAEVVRAEKEQASMIKEFRENLERLNSYTGKAYAPHMEVEALSPETSKNISEPAKVIEDTPEYKARMKELEALQYKEKAAKNNYLPDISLYGRYDYYGSDVNGPENAMRDIREAGYNAGLLIRLPIFDGGARKWEKTKSLYEIRKQQESIRATIEEKGRDINTIYAGYTELMRALGHYRRLADQYGKLRAISRKAHELGQESMAGILEMEKDFLAVERDLKVTVNSLAIYEKRLSLETDYNNFVREFYGNGACQH